MIVTFTDFGVEGPYLGQVKAVLHRRAPGVAVVDLMADAPACGPRPAAYLLAALAPEFPAGSVFLCVVDPGVGGSRMPVVVKVDGRLFVGPDNGLFEPLCRRGAGVAAWSIAWRPERLSATFHGRDLFAPVAARLAAGASPEQAGCVAIPVPRRPDWPDDLAEVIYVDHYGNCLTGLRSANLSPTTVLKLAGRELRFARTFGDVPDGTAFWLANSSGLVEVAVSMGRADRDLGIGIGTGVQIV